MHPFQWPSYIWLPSEATKKIQSLLHTGVRNTCINNGWNKEKGTWEASCPFVALVWKETAS